MVLPVPSRTALRLASIAGLATLVACATPPKPGAEPTAPAPASPAVAPAPAPVVPAPAPEPVPAPAPVSPQEAQRALAAAIEALQGGQEEVAEAELAKVLQAEPGNRLAQSLLRQIKDDPVAVLGRESFQYRVQPGESLSRIAQRFLNDVHQFYILARYNGIKVPRNLAGGQMIRVPGKAPPPGSVPPAGSAATGATTPGAAPAPASAGTASPAPAPSSGPAAPAAAGAAPPAVPAAGPVGAAAEARARADAVARHTRAARAAFAKQDLDAAIASWDAVLELEPNNRTALLEKQRVQGLKERLTRVKQQGSTTP